MFLRLLSFLRDSRALYSTIHRADNDDTNPPPPAPRRARFATSNVWMLVLGLFVGWVAQLWLSRMWLNPRRLYSKDFEGWSVIWTTLLVFAICFSTAIRIGLLVILKLQLQAIRRQRELFTNGVSALATVDFIGAVTRPQPMANTSYSTAIRWSYDVDGNQYTGETPRDQLPIITLGDKFWILYEEADPWYARRWARFDWDGNSQSNDELTWKNDNGAIAARESLHSSIHTISCLI